MPRLAPLIKWMKQAMKEDESLDFHITIAPLSPGNFLEWLFRKEIKSGRLTYGVKPVLGRRVIQPHASKCLWARERGSRLLNKILREEVQLNALQIGMNIEQSKDVKNILLLKRHSRRVIKNFDALRNAVLEKYTPELGYRIYVHDDKYLNKTNPFEYYIEFYKADIVIGAFGAGLVNIVFSKPGTAVILIQGSRHKNHRMYLGHSTALGMKYYAYYTDTRWTINVEDIMKVIALYA